VKAVGSRELLPVFGLAAVIAFLGVGPLYATMPALPTLAGVVLLVLAAAEAIMAWSLKARIERRPGSKPLQPLIAARAVALAQASALAATIMGGAWLGLLGYLLPRRDELAAAGEDTPAAVVGLFSAGALVAAALWLQYCCRTPPEDDDPDRRHRRV